MQAFVLAERLRDAGLDVILHCASATGAGSLKSQMKKADASGAAFAVIIGEDEVASHTAAVKSMRAGAGSPASSATVAFDEWSNTWSTQSSAPTTTITSTCTITINSNP